jgi:hypothetical protein
VNGILQSAKQKIKREADLTGSGQQSWPAGAGWSTLHATGAAGEAVALPITYAGNQSVQSIEGALNETPTGQFLLEVIKGGLRAGVKSLGDIPIPGTDQTVADVLNANPETANRVTSWLGALNILPTVSLGKSVASGAVQSAERSVTGIKQAAQSAELGPYPELFGGPKATGYGTANPMPSQHGMPYSEFEISDAPAKVTGIKSGYLKNVLEHPELYKQYPDLADLPVTSKLGSSYYQGGKINIEPNDADISTTLHEVQHAIQGIENPTKVGLFDAAGSIKGTTDFNTASSRLSDILYSIDSAERQAYNVQRRYAGSKSYTDYGDFPQNDVINRYKGIVEKIESPEGLSKKLAADEEVFRISSNQDIPTKEKPKMYRKVLTEYMKEIGLLDSKGKLIQ